MVATAQLGVEMQFCMAWAHHVFGSVEWPAVTNVRAIDDRGKDLDSLVSMSILIGLVELG